eukprot:g53422.t1
MSKSQNTSEEDDTYMFSLSCAGKKEQKNARPDVASSTTAFSPKQPKVAPVARSDPNMKIRDSGPRQLSPDERQGMSQLVKDNLASVAKTLLVPEADADKAAKRCVFIMNENCLQPCWFLGILRSPSWQHIVRRLASPQKAQSLCWPNGLQKHGKKSRNEWLRFLQGCKSCAPGYDSEEETSESSESGYDSEEESGSGSEQETSYAKRHAKRKSPAGIQKKGPKQLRTAYIFFCKDARPKAIEENPNMSFGEISKLVDDQDRYEEEGKPDDGPPKKKARKAEPVSKHTEEQEDISFDADGHKRKKRKSSKTKKPPKPPKPLQPPKRAVQESGSSNEDAPLLSGVLCPSASNSSFNATNASN